MTDQRRDDLQAFKEALLLFEREPEAGFFESEVWLSVGFLMGAGLMGGAAVLTVLFERQFPGRPEPRIVKMLRQ